MSLSRRLVDIPDALTFEEFWGMFGQIEYEMLDFKWAVSKDIRETIPAMANLPCGLGRGSPPGG